MTQLVRGLVWRGRQTVTLFLLGTVVVAGCLVAARFSELTGIPAGSVGVLLLLGVVALSVQAAASARSRRSEIALAQIRGRHGVRLFAYVLTEPVTVLLLATVAGVLLGRLVIRLAADRWLETAAGEAERIGRLGWWTVGIAVSAGVAAVLAGSWRILREPLVEQLDPGHRPRPSATVILFGQTVVIVAAVIAAFQATQHPGMRGGWAGIVNPALLSPILLGLAAGQLAAWGLRSSAALAARRSRGPERLGAFLAVRRLARRSDTVVGTRLMIAAAVVTAVTASATNAVAVWQDESTRLSLGGPRQYPVDSGALAAYQASHLADPAGRWLMAMVSAPDASEPYRRVFADTDRWQRVVGDFLEGTGAGSVSDQTARLQVGRPIDVAAGEQASVVFTNRSLLGVSQVMVTLNYATSAGSIQPVSFRPERPSSGAGVTTVTTRLEGCDDGCSVVGLSVEGRRPRGRARFVDITTIDFAGQSLLSRARWITLPSESTVGSGQRADRLKVGLNYFGDPTDFHPAGATQRLAALTTPGLSLDSSRKGAIAYAVDGSEHLVEEVGHVTALPMIGRTGALLDLPRAMAGGGSTLAAGRAVIVARGDTPVTVLKALGSSGAVGEPRTFTSSLERAQRRPEVQGVRLYTLMSLFAALIAFVGLAAALSGQRLERQREAASLRVTGVRARHIRAAHRREALWLAVWAGVAVGATGWLAARLTLEGLALVPQTAYSPVLEGDPRWSTVAAVAVGAGLLVGLVTWGVNHRIARSSPPSLLREEMTG